MKNQSYGIIGIVLFCMGILAYAWFNEYIIINPRRSILAATPQATASKKKVDLYFFKENWQPDQVQLLLSENETHNAQIIVGKWLENAFDESILKKKVLLQTAFITADKELILSFDRSLFTKESSTFDKWMIIEGILKSLRHIIPNVKKVRFLINHQPIDDPHLDFSNAWPSSGFAY